MAAGAVQVRGLRELQRDFRKLSKEVSKEIRKGLKDAVEPVRQEAQSLFSPIDSRSAAGYRVAVRARGVAIEQRIGRTTGHHPEFGALQMRRALLPARASKFDEVIDRLDRDVLGRLEARYGF